MPDLTPTEARERLENTADREILNHSLAGTHSVTADAAEKVLDAILATTDALEALGFVHVERFGTYLDPAVYGDKYDHHTFTHCAPIPDGNGQPGNVALYRLTDPEAAP